MNKCTLLTCIINHKDVIEYSALSPTCDDSPRVQLHADDVPLVGLKFAIIPDLNSARPVDDAHVPEVHVAAEVAGRQDVSCTVQRWTRVVESYFIFIQLGRQSLLR